MPFLLQSRGGAFYNRPSTTLLGIGLPVNDLASWSVSTTILGWFCVSMVWHHGLYHFGSNRLACPWFGFMVCIYNNTLMVLCFHGLASWFIPLSWNRLACPWFGFMVCIYNNTGLVFHGLTSWFIPLWLEQACLSMIWLHGLYLQQYSDGFVFPWFGIMVYNTLPGIVLPVHDWLHGLYLHHCWDGFVCPWFAIMVIPLSWNRLACPWNGFMVCIYNNTGMVFHGLSSWCIPLCLE